MIKFLIIIVFFIVLFLLRKALLPIAIGIAISYILDPYVTLLQKKVFKNRLICVFAAYLTVLILVGLLIFGFADIASGKISSGSLQDSIKILQAYYFQYQGVLDNMVGVSIGDYKLNTILKNVSGGAIKFLLGMLAGIYMLYDKEFFLRLANKAMHLLLNQKVHGILREILFEINDVVSSFLRGVFIDSVIVAFLSSLVLSIIGIDFSIFIGCFAGIANVIPYFGPIIGIIPAALAGISEGSITKAALATLGLFIVQQIECNVIYPKIIGNSTGLHPLFVLTAVSIAGYFGGIFWMVLAVPIAGILRVLIVHWSLSQ